MCGIVGYIGKGKAQEILVAGLQKLEYRGYDSAGIYVVDENKKGHIFKETGHIAALKEKVNFIDNSKNDVVKLLAESRNTMGQKGVIEQISKFILERAL